MSLKAQSEAAPEHVRAQIKAARQSEATKEQAQTQSHADREEAGLQPVGVWIPLIQILVQNFQIALNLVGAKIQNDPSSVTKEDAAYLQSRESRASESGYVEKDSISAEIQRLADANEKTGSGTVVCSTVNPQSSWSLG